jgi:hypothetical protein
MWTVFHTWEWEIIITIAKRVLLDRFSWRYFTYRKYWLLNIVYAYFKQRAKFVNTFLCFYWTPRFITIFTKPFIGCCPSPVNAVRFIEPYFSQIYFNSILAERRCLMAVTPSSYSWGPGLKPWPGMRLSWRKSSRFHSVSTSKVCSGNLNRPRPPLPYLSFSNHSRHCSLSY